MKKSVLLLLIVSIVGFSNCKEKTANSEGVARYAKYEVSVRKDAELNGWVATLNECEKVTLLETLTVPDKKKEGKNLELARVRLADDKEGFIKTAHLAKLPIFFIKESDAYRRPTIGSPVTFTISKGQIAFILDEKDEWAHIYFRVNDKGREVWVPKSVFNTDPMVLRQALDYKNAVELYNEGEAKDEEDKVNQALEAFDNLRKNQNVIGELAQEKYSEITGETGAGGADATPEDAMPDETLDDLDAEGENDTTENAPQDQGDL